MFNEAEQARLAQEPFGYCEHPCNGPIEGRTWAYLAISHVAYWVWMHHPGWLAMNKLGMMILPRAGDIAFACTCQEKNDAARIGGSNDQ